MNSEILAPAGSFDSVTAAVRCGANAVYLGGKSFNARRNASNFSGEELAKAVKYCHERNVKVYQTLNILVDDAEIDEAVAAIIESTEAGVDALIIQDVGLAAVVRQVSPFMPLHASTQMSVQSIDGIKELEKLGFRRVVIPRELSREEIIKIAESTDMELEYFVHGALCMCVSGQCLMSSVLGGRSGNRGLCAQPCRLPFGVNGQGGNCLSLKDSSLIDYLKDLEKIGVTSFKIEGRMKRPEYVAAAVTACKNSLLGVKDTDLKDSLEAIFSRSGFTQGYYQNKRGKDMFGIRRKEDVVAATPVLKELSSLYEKETPLIDVEMKLQIKSDKPVVLECAALGKRVTVCEEASPQKALSKSITVADAETQLKKCGGTQYNPSSVICDIDDGLFLPVSVLNKLRREALEKLSEEISFIQNHDTHQCQSSSVQHKAEKTDLHIRVFREEQIPDNTDDISRIIIPVDCSAETAKKLIEKNIEVSVEIPRAYFSNSEVFYKHIEVLKNAGVTLCTAGTLDGFGLAEKLSMKCSAGFGTNIFNSISLSEYEKLGAVDCLISPELHGSKISLLDEKVPRGAIVYGKLPLILTRNCPIKNKLTCDVCKGNSCLVDRMNISFPVICKNGCSEILNSRPLSMTDRPIKNIDYALLYFTNESKEECKSIIENYLKKEKISGEYTRGLYEKGVI